MSTDSLGDDDDESDESDYETSESSSYDVDEKEDNSKEDIPRLHTLYWLDKILIVVVFFTNIIILILSIVVMAMVLYIKGNTGYVLRSFFNSHLRRPSSLVPIWYPITSTPLGNWLGTLYTIMLVISSLCIIAAVLGILAALVRNKLSLFVYFVILLAVLLMDIVLFSAYFSTSTTFHKEAVVEIKKKIHDKYGVLSQNELTSTMNMIMIMGECCGVKGIGDFSRINLTLELETGVNPHEGVHARDAKGLDPDYVIPFPNVSYSNRLQLPPACCKDEVFQASDVPKRFHDVIDCAEDISGSSPNTRGCYDFMFGETRGEVASIDVMVRIIFGLMVMLVFVVTAKLGKEIFFKDRF